MKSSQVSNAENRIALRQLLQTGNDVICDVIIWIQDGNCNITINQDNPIKTVGRDSFFEPQNP